jgi:hypothetical protein
VEGEERSVRVHRRLLQSATSPFIDRISLTDRLRAPASVDGYRSRPTSACRHARGGQGATWMSLSAAAFHDRCHPSCLCRSGTGGAIHNMATLSDRLGRTYLTTDERIGSVAAVWRGLGACSARRGRGLTLATVRSISRKAIVGKFGRSAAAQGRERRILQRHHASSLSDLTPRGHPY